MDPTADGRPEPDDVRIARIRLDIERTRARIVENIDALEYKADIPARIADVLSATASNVTARILQAFPSKRSTSTDGTPSDTPTVDLTEP
jgi:hypothetical protein